MRATNLLAAFLGGAIVGAGAALLFAPEKGEDLRGQIKTLLKKYGVCKCSRAKSSRKSWTRSPPKSTKQKNDTTIA